MINGAFIGKNVPLNMVLSKDEIMFTLDMEI
jgi:hypothetical protein